MKKVLFVTLSVVLSLCIVMEPTHVSAITADLFAARVNQLSKGELDVQVYHSRQLGDALANVENIRNGSIAFTSVSIANLSQVIPAMDMFSLPYIFKNDAHYWYCIQHANIDKFMAQLEPKGIKRISWITSGARSLFTQKPVRTPADLKGQKIRVMVPGYDQHHEGPRGKRCPRCLGRALQCTSDRCCGWCGEQPAVSDLHEVL